MLGQGAHEEFECACLPRRHCGHAVGDPARRGKARPHLNTGLRNSGATTEAGDTSHRAMPASPRPRDPQTIPVCAYPAPADHQKTPPPHRYAPPAHHRHQRDCGPEPLPARGRPQSPRAYCSPPSPVHAHPPSSRVPARRRNRRHDPIDGPSAPTRSRTRTSHPEGPCPAGHSEPGLQTARRRRAALHEML